ncbi:MAG TPA: SDR family oxidoreductase [Acidobacteriaceae bacterium]|nr:SDR family oxidoreductase [Acidobacteriaceae bacterium]
MQMTGNTILITGGSSGIGRALAIAFHQLGNQVIVAGRRQALMEEIVARNPRIHAAVVDVQNLEGLPAFADDIVRHYPNVNVLINNAGIMKPENLNDGPAQEDVAGQTIATNLLAPMRLTGLLLPHLKKQRHAAIMNVSSGLAFVPMATTPTYCATKAAVHSWTQSLRYQLRDTSVDVLELVPPYVQTELMGTRQAQDPRAMPLDEFVAEVIDILRNHPEQKEILVQRVHPLRYAAEQGRDKYDEFVRSFNDSMANPGSGSRH